MNKFMTTYEYEELRCKLCNSLFGDCNKCPLSKLEQGCSPDSEYEVICDDRINILQKALEEQELFEVVINNII